MRRILVTLLAFVSPYVAKSADTLVTGYHRQAIYSVSGAFTEVDNWNAGGENSSNVSFCYVRTETNKGINFTTVHLLEGNYGLSRQAGTLTKNADRLEFTTTLTGSPKTTEWNLSSQFNVRTQLAPGYAKGDTSSVPISTFGAPIYGQFSFGVGNNSFDHWQVFLSPLAGKSTTVLDADLRNKAAFGVDIGATWRLEAGAKITLNYNQQFSEAFSITAKSDIFYNYWGPLSATDFMLDIIALYDKRSLLCQCSCPTHSGHRSNRCLATPFGVGNWLAYTIK